MNEFLEIINALFALKKACPSMHWDIEEGPEIRVTLPVTPEVAEAFENGRRMFEPVEEN